MAWAVLAVGLGTIVAPAAAPAAAVPVGATVDVPGGAVQADCSRTHTGRKPINDLGQGTYLGQQGGLYPGGFNFRPAGHESAGRSIATNQVRPRDRNGNVDLANGRVVMITIGMSNTTQESQQFIADAAADPAVDPQLTIVDGAQGGQGAAFWTDPAAPTWQVLANRLANAGMTAPQVQTLWLKQQYNQDAIVDFPADAARLRDDLRTIVRIARSKYPNLRMAYLSSRSYGDYSGEPRGTGAYESAFAVKWLVADQIAGDPALDYTGADAVAPWLSWGPYLWADGLGADGVPGGVPGRSDGLEWRCSDYNTDGIHPSATGRQKVSTLLLRFFKRDTTTGWFVG